MPEVVQRLFFELSPSGVMGEPLDVLTEAIPVERLDRLDDPRMKPVNIREVAALLDRLAVEVAGAAERVDARGGLVPVGS